MSFVKRYKYEFALFGILIIAAILRFYKLGHASLWYDELYTLNEASPYISWKQLFYYCQTDQHPPLYFIIQRFAFNALGYTEWAARSVSAIAGVFSVWAMYKLGKEIANRDLGIIAALITCVNEFSLYHSHEARSYPLVWLLTALSYMYFIRAFKTLKANACIGYILCTTALIYTNYFGFIVMFCEALMGLLLLFGSRNKMRTFLMLACCGVIVFLAYLPWLPNFLKQTALHPYWLKQVPISFVAHYYYDYFGAEIFLLPFLLLLPVTYAVNVYRLKRKAVNFREDPVQLSFVFLVVSIVVPYVVLYLRSILQWPSLQHKYTTVVLPGIIILLSYGFVSIKNVRIRYALLATFICISIWSLLWRQKFFSFPYEAPNRQAVEIMAAKDHPVVNESMSWHLMYYSEKYNYTGRVFKGSKNKSLDSIINKRTARFDVDTFWVFIGHVDHPMTPKIRKELDSSFNESKEYLYNSVSLRLYTRKVPDAGKR
jgi:mannosyltransferase